MEKRKHTLSLSFVLLRFVAGMFVTMLLCFMIWSLVTVSYTHLLAAIAAGADGLIVEVHNNPEKAWSDGAQSLKPEKFKTMIEKGRVIAQVIGRDI